MKLNLGKKKLLLGLFLSICSIQAHSDKLQSSLVDLLKQTRQAQHYWNTLQYQEYRRFFKVVPWKWNQVWGNDKITYKQKSLQEVEQELAHSLGSTLDPTFPLSKTRISKAVARTRNVLRHCCPPAHYQQHWVGYTLTAATILGACWWINKHQNGDLLYVIQGPNIKHTLKGSLKDRHYHYTKDKKYQYLRIKKSDTQTFEPLLQHEEGVTFTKHRPELKDLPLYGYDESGNHLLRNFYEDHMVKPVKNIVSIISKDNENDTTFVQDIGAGTKVLLDDLDELIIAAQEDPIAQKLVEKHIKGKPLDEVPRTSKFNFLDEMIAVTHKEIPTKAMDTIKKFRVRAADHKFDKVGATYYYGEEIRPLAIKVDELLNTFKYALELLQDGIQENSGLYTLSFKAHSLYVNQLRLEKSVLMNKIHELSEEFDLNFKLMATIPAMLFTYASYKIFSNVISRFTSVHTLTPLKKDLIQFQLMLNKERHTKVAHKTSLFHKGMCFYWIEQLKMYDRNIPSNVRASYAAYLENLNNLHTTPEQKLTIIECMFREYDFLH
jgi:hypothetical protein